jgi:ABC-type glutathione transport system ATPase component
MTESSTGDAVLRVSDLTIETAAGRVLDRVSLEVAREEVLGVVADSDASTSALAAALVNEVAGFSSVRGEVRCAPPDGDPVSVLDLDRTATRRFRWATVALVDETPADSFNPTTTVRKHFAETLAAHRADRQAGMALARDLLSALGLDAERTLDAYPEDLAGATSERAALALSAVLDPAVIAFDGIPSTVRAAPSSLDALREYATFATVFLGTDFGTIASLADRLVVVDDGAVVETGPTGRILDDPQHPYTRQLVDFVGDDWNTGL